jgi:hypothetical protein
MRFLATLVVALVGLSACDKVPLVDIEAGFTLADAVWFEDEQTLFIFYRAGAQQGIEPVSLMELRYRTDDEAVAWTPLTSITPVHPHLPVDCGPRERCGSWSLKVPRVPRDVGLRLRYHPQGSLALEADVKLSVVASGPPFSNRSLVMYGVFDEQNLHVQWRARHQFPNLHNQEVEALGLRRPYVITDARSGDVPAQGGDNPYWYAAGACPGQDLGWAPLATQDRAVFEERELPVSTSADTTVCATSTITDALGTFAAVAVARKNPQVRPAFPTLRSPVRPVVQVPFMLRVCQRDISAEHLSMQEQRLLLAGAPTICLDAWRSPGFSDALATTFKNALDVARPQGQDLVLTFALHHDEPTGQLAQVVADALTAVLIPERDKSTPRAVGAFVLDSYGQKLPVSALSPLVLWCPALVGPDLDNISPTSARACPLLPDAPDLVLGPFKFNQLPILPTREQYLTFVGKYGVEQAGTMKTLTFTAPELTTVSQNVPLGDFGVATFFDDEVITPAPADALSFCAPTDLAGQSMVFRTALLPMPLPLQQLPEFHRLAPQPTYFLGLAWDSPFLLRLNYEVVLAGQASAFTLSVPFGIKSLTEKYVGNELWKQSEFDLTHVLAQCTRFCDAPTFDSAGVYGVLAPFRTTYEAQCYAPLFPKLGDGGSPLDP